MNTESSTPKVLSQACAEESVFYCVMRLLVCFDIYFYFRDVNKLIDGLEPVLDDPLKLQMLHCISRLLPPAAQLEFERLAVEMVARHMESKFYKYLITGGHAKHLLFTIHCS